MVSSMTLGILEHRIKLIPLEIGSAAGGHVLADVLGSVPLATQRVKITLVLLKLLELVENLIIDVIDALRFLYGLELLLDFLRLIQLLL